MTLCSIPCGRRQWCLVNYFYDVYLRWFDSGDLQGANHLRNIVTVAKSTPQVCHWLPTRELPTVKAVLRQIGVFPKNLTVRVSAAMVDGKPPKGFENTSSVVTEGETCPSRDQGGVCGDCRDCWDRTISNVAYGKH